MNFPGLDPFWSGLHHAARGLGAIRPWTLEEARAELAREGKVLVVATTALGDSLLTLPLVESLAQALGHARVSLLVRAPYADLFRGDPRLHRVFSVRGKYRWEGLVAGLKRDPHRIALLANMTEPDLVPALWHGGVRAFLRYPTRWTRYPRWMANAEMLRPPGAPDYATGHAIENNLAMAEALRIAPSTHRLALPQWAAKERTRRVLIHPGASRAIKRWPLENWVRVADALVETYEVDLMLTGSDAEKPLAQAVKDGMARPDRAEVVTGALTLPKLAAAQSGSVAFLSGDTGPYHLAVAVGCPTVTLFAPTDRGSSMEACGPHQADPALHRAIQTAALGDSIGTILFEAFWAEVEKVMPPALARDFPATPPASG